MKKCNEEVKSLNRDVVLVPKPPSKVYLWHVLSSDHTTGHSFKRCFANKWAKNLGDFVVKPDCYTPSPHFLSQIPGGNFSL